MRFGIHVSMITWDILSREDGMEHSKVMYFTCPLIFTDVRAIPSQKSPFSRKGVWEHPNYLSIIIIVLEKHYLENQTCKQYQKQNGTAPPAKND